MSLGEEAGRVLPRPSSEEWNPPTLARVLNERGAGAAPARTLLDVFAHTVATSGGRLAIDAGEPQLTYAELSAAAVAVSERLRLAGVGPGDRVGVYVPSGSADLHIAILGALHAGAAYVPVDADDPPARASAIWEGAGACVVIEAGLRIRELAPPEGAERELGIDDDAWVIFTSGSTGRPKGVAVTHRSAAAFVDAEAELWQIRPEDRVLAGLSVGFDASCEEMWIAWRHGAALVPAPRALVRAASDLGPWLGERRVTVVSTVPTLAAMWDEADLRGIRLLILGGEACPEPLAWRLAAEREVWNTYGPTEATVVSTAGRVRAGQPVTIGWPLAGWEVAVVDDRGRPVQLGEPGELAIAGVGLGRYVDPALDGERFTPLPALDWDRAYRTGDIVRESIDGLQFVGRGDDQVKLDGRRLELSEIDALLRAVPGVRAGSATVQTSEAGNSLLVGYVVGDVEPDYVRSALAERLPHGIAPLIVPIDSLPTSAAGKLDRKALPWPPPVAPSAAPNGASPVERPSRSEPASAEAMSATALWLAERWAEQLGPLPMSVDSDFFALGGSSLAAAKLVSVLRARYPSVAIADVYAYRRLGQLADRLDSLSAGAEDAGEEQTLSGGRWGLAQLAGVFSLLALTAPQWLIGILAFDRWQGAGLGPQVAWGWLIAGGLIFGTPVGRATVVVIVRRLLLPSLKPGRYPRRSWLTCRLWFLERLAEGFRSESLAGTPFAARYARLCGHRVGAGARLGTLPPVTSLLSIGEGATLESDVDAHGWWLEGDELVVGELRIGPGARVGTRALLGPGAEIGAGAEIEPGSVITGRVAPGERWAGSPARLVGRAGEAWPASPAPRPEHPRRWRAMYGCGLAVQALLPLLAVLPGLAVLEITGVGHSDQLVVTHLIAEAPIIAGGFIVSYALLVALLVRYVGKLVQPGWHPDEGRTGWALWFSEAVMAGGRGVLFSVYSSIYTRAWLRLAGVPVGKRAEVSTAVGLGRLTSFGAGSFAADDVVLAVGRARQGWLRVAPIEIGPGTFLGNGAILEGGTKLGKDGLIGVLTIAPRETADGTSWFGSPPLELPRVPDPVDPARTINPPPRLVIARGTMDLIRILLPATISVILAALIFWVLATTAGAAGVGAMVLVTPLALLAAGIVATAMTVAAKWLIIGRYRAGEHPLWSFFVWRDEVMNSLQDQLAGTWLLGFALGSALLPLYLRAMGAKVGRGVWCESLTITEFDMVKLEDGCVVNRFACIETHLFHDRLLRIGPTRLGARSSIGPATAVLPDTAIGARARVGGRSVVLRGEELPPRTRWHGAPVSAV